MVTLKALRESFQDLWNEIDLSGNDHLLSVATGPLNDIIDLQELIRKKRDLEENNVRQEQFSEVDKRTCESLFELYCEILGEPKTIVIGKDSITFKEES